MSLSVYGFDSGQLTSIRMALTVTTPVIIVPSANNRQTVLFIALSNVSAAPVNVSLETEDGTGPISLITVLALPARGTTTSVYTYELPIVLERLWTIKATASIANVVHVHATLTSPPPGKTP